MRREVSARYQGSFLGLFWSYVQPATKLAMYYFVIGVIVNKGIENFAIHLFAGLIVVHYFTETFGAGTRSIVRNKSLVRKMAVPREMFPVASMLVSAYHVIPGMVLLTGSCIFLGWRPDPVGMAAALLGFLLIAVLGTALALLFSAANVFFRDFSNVVQTLTQFTTFSVPMIYPYSKVGRPLRRVRPLLPAQPDGGGGAAVPARLLGRHHQRPRRRRSPRTCPTTCSSSGFVHLAAWRPVLLGVAQLVFTRLENKIPERL